jgi:hypothetical protein
LSVDFIEISKKVHVHLFLFLFEIQLTGSVLVEERDDPNFQRFGSEFQGNVLFLYKYPSISIEISKKSMYTNAYHIVNCNTLYLKFHWQALSWLRKGMIRISNAFGRRSG